MKVAGQLTTHVLDTRSGRPAAGLHYTLFRYVDGFASVRRLTGEGVTGADGRCEKPLLQGDDFQSGEYCLEFDAEEYFRRVADEEIDRFLGVVSLNFRVTDPYSHYHIPLILSPFGYSTYRGS